MGEFVFKFIRELNSATSSNSLILAIVLGLIGGFLPTVNFFTILIFLIVLIFRIPIGLFIASYTFFDFIGFLVEPLLSKIGFVILTSSFLKPLWTFFYNLPFFRWSGFNNTIVMGGLVLGVIFGIILYFVLKRSIELYRSFVFEKLKNIKYLKWLVPDEKKGIIRLSGIIFIFLIVLVLILFFTLLLDPIVKLLLEFSLSRTLHKNVAIERVDTSLGDLSINITNMQIGDILFEKTYTKLDWSKIVWRKYKIDDLKIYAKSNKNIYDVIKGSSSKTNKVSIKISKLTFPNPQDLLAKQNLKSIKALEKLKKDYKKVQKDIDNLKKYKEEFIALQRELDNLKNIKIKNPNDLQELIAKIDKIKKESKKISDKIKNSKLLSDKRLIEKDLKDLKVALKEDKENIASKYEMIKNKEYLKFSETILKPKISWYLQKIYDIYQKVEPFLSSKDEKEYTRSEGVYIKFEDKIKYPDFVLVKSDIKLKTSIANWNLIAKNISDNQKLLNKKGVIDIKGKGKFFDVGGNISYLERVDFRGYGNNIYIKKMDLDFARMDALADIKVDGYLKKDYINSKVLANFKKVKFYSKKINLDSVKRFKLIIFIKGNIKNPQIKIDSDLDEIISKVLKRLIKKEQLKAKKLLDNKINSNLKKLNLNEITSQIDELNSFNVEEVINKKASEIIKSKQKNLGNTIRSLLKF